MSNAKSKSLNTALLGMFAAIVVVLQLLSYAIKIGTFNLSLVLIPIVLSAVMFGPRQSTVLGGVFGVVVVICCIAGLDGGGYVLFTASPILTVLVCLIKGIAAGLCGGLVAKLTVKKNLFLSVILTAIVTPIVNTGLFSLAMVFLFRDTLNVWANGTDLVYYVLFSLIGINFLIELGVNVVLSPVILKVTKALKKIR